MVAIGWPAQRFFLLKSIQGTNRAFTWLITAKHVIEGIREKGINEVYIRVNNTHGLAVWEAVGNIDLWKFHPTDTSVDVAVIDCVLDEGLYDHLGVGTDLAMNQELRNRYQIALGDEVLVTGLFRHHHGARKNIPIVRTGNLAALDEEKVVVRTGEIDAYLIESRSIGGLSGSPVFVNIGNLRAINGQLMTYATAQFVWLGIIHGHYDATDLHEDEVVEDAVTATKINVGIAIVIPASKVLETIEPLFQERLLLLPTG
jgi:hypothetical protein